MSNFIIRHIVPRRDDVDLVWTFAVSAASLSEAEEMVRTGYRFCEGHRIEAAPFQPAQH
jgi:hypothetical protein